MRNGGRLVEALVGVVGGGGGRKAAHVFDSSALVLCGQVSRQHVEDLAVQDLEAPDAVHHSLERLERMYTYIFSREEKILELRRLFDEPTYTLTNARGKVSTQLKTNETKRNLQFL